MRRTDASLQCGAIKFHIKILFNKLDHWQKNRLVYSASIKPRV